MSEQPTQPEASEPPPKPRPPPTPAEERASFLRWAAFWVVLILWFGYDGWYNEDEKMKQHRAFNRSGAYIFVGATLYCLGQAIRYHFISRRTPVPQQPEQEPPPGDKAS